MTLQMFGLVINLPAYFLVFLRISSFFISFPITSNKFVSARLRVMFAFTITLMVITIVKLPALPAFMSVSMMLLAVQQILIGILSGFVFSIMFEIFLFGGQVISMQMGLGFATLVDPTVGSVNMLSQFYWFAALLIFLAFNGDLVFIKSIINSFNTLPINVTAVTAFKLKTVAQYSAEIFSGAISIALPAIIALLIVNVMFAIMTRSSPTLNIFVVGFPITLVFGFFVVYLTFTGVFSQASHFFQQAFTMLRMLLSGGVANA